MAPSKVYQSNVLKAIGIEGERESVRKMEGERERETRPKSITAYMWREELMNQDWIVIYGKGRKIRKEFGGKRNGV